MLGNICVGSKEGHRRQALYEPTEGEGRSDWWVEHMVITADAAEGSKGTGGGFSHEARQMSLVSSVKVFNLTVCSARLELPLPHSSPLEVGRHQERWRERIRRGSAIVERGQQLGELGRGSATRFYFGFFGIFFGIWNRDRRLASTKSTSILGSSLKRPTFGSKQPHRR